jgi:hypothetical protein
MMEKDLQKLEEIVRRERDLYIRVLKDLMGRGNRLQDSSEETSIFAFDLTETRQSLVERLSRELKSNPAFFTINSILNRLRDSNALNIDDFTNSIKNAKSRILRQEEKSEKLIDYSIRTLNKTINCGCRNYSETDLRGNDGNACTHEDHLLTSICCNI